MLRVGLIGLGGIARSHADGIAQLEDVELVACADLIESTRAQFMDNYDVPKGYASHTELLEDSEIDAVGVVLGHQLHHRLSVDALNAGKHVLVEKPMALTLEQCDEMIAAARANDVKLMVGLTNHFLPVYIKAKEILDSGQLGPLITIVSYMSKNWNFANRRPQYRSRFHGGGMWLSNGVHVVDRVTWFMGSQAVSVSASIGTRAHYQAGDDSATAFIRYKNGLAGVAVSVGYADGGPIHDTHVICADGSLRFSHSASGRGLWIGQGETWEEVEYEHWPQRMRLEWGRFAEAIEQDIESPVPGEYGRHIMEILLAAETSELTRSEVLLESGEGWSTQAAGEPVQIQHGWV